MARRRREPTTVETGGERVSGDPSLYTGSTTLTPKLDDTKGEGASIHKLKTFGRALRGSNRLSPVKGPSTDTSQTQVGLVSGKLDNIGKIPYLS